jgi:GDP-L-fucose synthase
VDPARTDKVNMFYKNKTVLVTGGTGFIGTNFVEELVGRGARVRVPIHHRPLLVKSGLVEAMPGDLSRIEDCLALCKGVNYVIHAGGGVAPAAVTNSATSINPMSVINLNLIVSAQMLQAAWVAGVERFLMLSSTTVYPPAERPIREDEAWSAPPYPAYFAYGWMRRYLERMAEFVTARSPMKIALIRPTAAYGRYDDFHPIQSHVIPALIRKAVEQLNPYEVWGSGDEVRDFVHVTDIVRGGLLALEKHAACDPINIGYGHGFTIKDVVRIILRETGHSAAQVQFNTSKPTTIPFRMVDIAKARSLLGFEPKVSLEEGLADTVKWYLANRSLEQTDTGSAP